jgi:hypothetical protein
VIVNDARVPAGLARGLHAFVAGGGGLVVALGERSSWLEGAGDLLPGTVGEATDLGGSRGGTLGFVEYSHPIFEIFAAPRSGDLTAARVFRYRRIAPDGSAAVLARFEDGGIAFAERKVGRGTVLAWTSTLDTFWTDLPLAPVFLPLVHAVLTHVSVYRPPAPARTVGEVADLSRALQLETPPDNAENRVALTPSGRRLPLAPVDGQTALELGEQGFYEIRRPGADGPRPLTLAANLDPVESDFTRLDPQELSAAVTGGPGTTEAAGRGTALEPSEIERRQSIWRFLLGIALILLVGETLLSNRLSRRPTA